jgi:hypothetical protein
MTASVATSAPDRRSSTADRPRTLHTEQPG